MEKGENLLYIQAYFVDRFSHVTEMEPRNARVR